METVVSVFCLILLPIAVARLTRLVVDDAITLPIRNKILTRFGEDGALTYLVHCTWCSAMWLAILAGVPVVVVLGLPVVLSVLVILATAQLAPMILSVADRIDAGS